MNNQQIINTRREITLNKIKIAKIVLEGIVEEQRVNLDIRRSELFGNHPEIKVIVERLK